MAMTEVGRVGRPHGLDGAFYVTRPEPGVLLAGLATSLGVVARVSGTGAKPIVHLEGVSTREAADALRGQSLLIERSALPLEEDEYWADDLVGLAVVDGERIVGVVERVRALPSCEVLEVGVTSAGGPNRVTSAGGPNRVTSAGGPNLRGPEAETLLVPLISDAVRDVDLERGVIDVDLGFLDAR